MKISIIIPSRERARYLGGSLSTATAIEDAGLEILVSDNASQDETRTVVASNPDPRIRYVNTGRRVSMRQNFEFALAESTGDYVIFFGDDDGVIPGQFALLRHILEAHRPDALSWSYPVYGWPSPGYGVKTGGLRITRAQVFGRPRPLDRDRQLRAVVEGRLSRIYPMPSIYHGCMSREFLQDCALPDGTVFAARSPDIYMNFRALVRGGNFLHINHPFTINGYSPASTGGSLRDVGQSEKTKSASSAFLSELAVDPVDDVLPVAMSMSLAFLGTLETVRHHFPDEPVTPRYQEWFRYGLVDRSRKSADVAAQIEVSLKDYALRLNAADALERARGQKTGSQMERLQRAWLRFSEKIGSFRLSAEIEGINTIETAAQMCDMVLGSDAMDVVAGRISPDTAWSRARARSRRFRRQL